MAGSGRPQATTIDTGRPVGRPLAAPGRMELAAVEARTVTTTMECAGNGRTFLEPQRDGARWESGAVGTAR